MPPAGFEPAIPTAEQPQTDALDRAATGIGDSIIKWTKKLDGIFEYICDPAQVKQWFITQYRISRPIRRTVIFSLEIVEKNNDERILILVIYWKKTGLLYTNINNHNISYSS